MDTAKASPNTHPTGESFSSPFLPPAQPAPVFPVHTPGGHFFVQFTNETPVTREGQLVFFFQFLEVSGLWKNFLADCPLTYTGNRGSGKLSVMGTIMLSIMAGHWRYAHINAIRGDGVNPGLLGMSKTVSEDTVRDALRRIPEDTGLKWLSKHLIASIEPMLKLPWIMDLDTTVKPLYGHQQGAEIAYNPTKPGRPSHLNHSYFIANLRLCLGTDVQPGKTTAARHSLPGLQKILRQLPRESWPTLLRGDSNYGNENFMRECEEAGLPYLFKQRHTKKVKELIQSALRQNKGWQKASDECEVMEATLLLEGWTKSRRVIIVREAPAIAPVGPNHRRRKDYQSDLPGTEAVEWKPKAVPWSGKIAVLVTSLDSVNFPAFATCTLYRQRGDMENNYDELKNQWGWGGYATQLLAPTRLMTNLIALFYNWWHLYVRLLESNHHREALTSRPTFMAGVGQQTSHAGQHTIKIALVHEKSSEIAKTITIVSNYLRTMRSFTEQWTHEERWATLLTHIWRYWLGGKWLSGVPPSAQALLSG